MKAVELFQRGYTDLVSVIPPTGRLSPASTIRPEARGKSPGVLYPSGMWGGYNWINTTPTAEDAARIDNTGANIGIRAASFPAVDIDIQDEALAARVAAVVESLFPTAPRRVGLWPKRLYAFRVEGPIFGRMQLHIGEDRHLIEILADGQQYLIGGTHPKTGKPYEWQTPLPESAADLPTLSRHQAEDLFTAIIEQVCIPLSLPVDRIGRGDIATRREVNQEYLKAQDMDTVEAAVKCIPNTNETFPTRESYIRLGYALKGASQEDLDRGLRIYTEWAMKWEGNANGRNTPERVEADWHRMRPPFEVGADWLYDVARQYGFDLARYEFPAEPAPVVTNPTQMQAEATNSDMWLADLFVSRYGGRVRYCPQVGRWLAWDGNIWRDDVASAVPGYVKTICVETANRLLRTGNTDAERRANTAVAKAMSSSRQMDAVLKLARLDTRVIAQSSDFDLNPDLLGTGSGVVDLRTGEVMTPLPEMLIAKSTATIYNPEAKCPRWDKFLDEITAGDKELRAYLQRIAGYMLTGHTREQVFFFFYGQGGNGKGTFMHTLEAILGSYWRGANINTFMLQRFEQHTTDLAGLVGARMVTAGEIQAGQSWNEQRLKMLTGEDAVTCRLMHKDEFVYVPTFKLLFAANKKPHFTAVDDAMRRRLHLVPFTQNFEKVKDVTLGPKLKNEMPGILVWAIAGARMYYESGLRPPACVEAATKTYFSDEDPFGRWLEECCHVGPEHKSKFSDLYTCFVDYNDGGGEGSTKITSKRFGQMLVEKGFKKERESSGHTVYHGLSARRGATDFEADKAA